MNRQTQVQVQPQTRPRPELAQEPPPCTDKIRKTWFREEES